MGNFFSKSKFRILFLPILLFLFFVFLLIFSLFSSHKKDIVTTPIVTKTAVTPANEKNTDQTNETQGETPSQKKISDYTDALGPPDYNFQGSRTYGGDALVYVYLKKGVAFTADPKTTQIYEQWNFQPMELEAFKQKYATKIIDFTVVPTLPEE